MWTLGKNSQSRIFFYEPSPYILDYDGVEGVYKPPKHKNLKMDGADGTSNSGAGGTSNGGRRELRWRRNWDLV